MNVWEEIEGADLEFTDEQIENLRLLSDSESGCAYLICDKCAFRHIKNELNISGCQQILNGTEEYDSDKSSMPQIKIIAKKLLNIIIEKDGWWKI